MQTGDLIIVRNREAEVCKVRGNKASVIFSTLIGNENTGIIKICTLCKEKKYYMLVLSFLINSINNEKTSNK